MANKGPYLTNGQFLAVGDYLAASNGLFFAILQGDGNFCVYRGPDPGSNYGFLWGSVQAAHYPPANGEYYVIMQGDGNLCGYKGTSPTDNHGFVWGSAQLWHYGPSSGEYTAAMQNDGNLCIYRKGSSSAVFCTMAIDPLADVDISSIDYDLKAAAVIQTNPTELYHDVLENGTDVSQSNEIDGSDSVTESAGWSDSTGYKVGVSTSFSAGIPILADGKISVSAEASWTFTQNRSTTKARGWSYKIPVTVPPHKTAVVVAAVSVSSIRVPYTVTGAAILTSGVGIPGIKATGVYLGTNSHDLSVTITQRDAKTGTVVAEIRQLPVVTLKDEIGHAMRWRPRR